MKLASKVTFNKAYKQWRNRARKYAPESVVRAAMQFLHTPVAEPLEDLGRAPWQVMLLVKWICQDQGTTKPIGRPITPDAFNDLRQRLWEFPERLHLGTRDTLPTYLFVRQLMRAQIGFQRRHSSGFVRESALLERQPPNHSLRCLFEDSTGVSIHAFMDLTTATYAAIMDGKLRLTTEWYKPFRTKYSDSEVDMFIANTSRTFPELVTFCRTLPDSKLKVASEYYEFPVISRYPFLRTDNVIECWHPAVFYRGMESFVHSVLSEAGQDFMDRFSKMFEDHVTGEAQKLTAPFIDEVNLREYVQPETKVPDGLLSFPECNIFIESKAGLFDESVMTVGHSDIFSHKTRALRTAVTQAWATSVSMRREKRAPPPVLNAEKDYLLIVTNRELSASRGTTLAAMYPPGTLDYADSESAKFLPLEHIYVLSVEDFERLISAASGPGFSLPLFLDRCVAADQNAKTAVFFFEQHLAREKVPEQLSELVANALDDIWARLTQLLGPSETGDDEC